MINLSILSPSIRTGRNSHRVALYFRDLLSERSIAETEVLDLAVYKFPLFEERLKYLPSPTEGMLEFSEKIKRSDGVIMIVPEYNGGYPASLKNVVDLLVDEWYRKPVAFVTVSDGNFAGTQVITSLQFSLWKLRAITISPPFRIPVVQKAFDENGKPENKADMDKRALAFIDSVMWFVEAKKRMGD